MGTSTSNNGQKGNTPLVPSWLNGGNVKQSGLEKENSKRFRAPRNNFTRFVNSGGKNTEKLRIATSSYIQQSLGGSENATMRIGAGRDSVANLISVFNGFITQGISDTQHSFSLGDIVGKDALDALIHLMNFVCPDGGKVDEGIARNAYIEAINYLSYLENKKIEDLTAPEYLEIVKVYIVHIIINRLVIDIGNKLFSLPKNASETDHVREQIVDYVKGAVSDAISELDTDVSKIKPSQAKAIVESIYKKSFDIMKESGDKNE